ncbi:MAG: biopolymer transporter ExbD [Opitutaceae bacterium]
MSNHRKRRRPEAMPELGFQIAPMIDVVFVVLVFFMSLTAAIKIEAELNTRLPAGIPTTASVDFPDEQTIPIDPDSQVYLNDAAFDTRLRRRNPRRRNRHLHQRRRPPLRTRRMRPRSRVPQLAHLRR